MDSINPKQEQNIKNILDASSFREPKKVPTAIVATTFPFAYAGTTYRSVMDNPVLAAQEYAKFFDEIEIDFATSIGLALPVNVYEALESDVYYLAEDDTCVSHDQSGENHLTIDEYELLIADPETAINDLFMKYRFPIFKEPKENAKEALRKAITEFDKFSTTNFLIMQKAAEKGIVTVLPFNQAPYFYSPFNWIFDRLRGFKDSLVDLRRRPETVKRACESLLDYLTADYKTDVEAIKKNFNGNPLPLGGTLYHSECFLSPKQYDELYFNNFKKCCGPYIEAGAKYFLMGEGSFLNTLDRFKELPKGSMMIMLENDDPFEAHKIIGDHQTLVTGINMNLLKHGSKQQCIDYAKKCFDTFAPGGGFIFSANAGLIGAKDVNHNNLRAVYEFANEYGQK